MEIGAQARFDTQMEHTKAVEELRADLGQAVGVGFVACVLCNRYQKYFLSMLPELSVLAVRLYVRNISRSLEHAGPQSCVSWIIAVHVSDITDATRFGNLKCLQRPG